MVSCAAYTGSAASTLLSFFETYTTNHNRLEKEMLIGIYGNNDIVSNKGFIIINSVEKPPYGPHPRRTLAVVA